MNKVYILTSVDEFYAQRILGVFSSYNKALEEFDIAQKNNRNLIDCFVDEIVVDKNLCSNQNN